MAQELAALPPAERGYVIMYMAQGEQIARAVAAATGHEIGPCRTTNMFDMQIKEIEAKNKVAEKAVDVGGDLLRWGLAGAVLHSTAKSAGNTAVAVGGDLYNESGNMTDSIKIDTKIKGDENQTDNRHK
jgi:hypothetical protein